MVTRRLIQLAASVVLLVEGFVEVFLLEDERAKRKREV